MNNVLKNILGAKALLFVGAVVALGLASRTPQLQSFYLRHFAGRNVVMISDYEERTGGTGAYVKTPAGRTVILTNSHVCGLSKEMPIFADGIPVRIVKDAPEVDLCALEPRAPTLLIAVMGKGLRLRSSGPDKGEILNVLGHPKLYPTTLTTGEYFGDHEIEIAQEPLSAAGDCGEGERAVQSFFGNICLRPQLASGTTAAILPGNSGSPVVDYMGRLVGVMFASDESMRGWMVKYSDVKTFLEGIK